MRKKQADEKIKIIPLGGLEAIGKNMTLFEYRDEIIIVDCGISFPTEENPGIDVIIPDFSYVVKNRSKVKALVVTHGHEDHIGAIPYLLNEVSTDVYATRFTNGLIQSRLREKPPRNKPVFHEIKPRDIVRIGNFRIEFIRVNHSISDGVGLAIQTDIGTIIHSGDFKIDFSPVDGQVTDIKRFSDYGEKGVLLLMSDSTNAEHEGFTKSEAILSEKMTKLFSSAAGRIIVSTFASNIHRIQQVLDIAKKFNKKVAVSGLSMKNNIEIATELGYLSYKNDILVDIEEAANIADNRLIIIGTGTQGEPMSALTRMAKATHKTISVKKGDTIIITASIIPGNERAVSGVVNSLMKTGATVFYAKEMDIHVSGHGSEKELALMLSVTKPHFFMPIHGEYRHLRAHADIASSLRIKPSSIIVAGNGDVMELGKNSFKKTDTLNLTGVYIESNGRIDATGRAYRERLLISQEGIIFVTLVASEKMLVLEPEVISRGIPADDRAIDSIKSLSSSRAVEMLKRKASAEEIEISVKKSIQKKTWVLYKKNPAIIVKLMEL